jgi:hypothetical protein
MQVIFQIPEQAIKSGWAIGLNRSFGSVCSVLKNFGLRKTTTDRWTSKTETDVFGFRFNRLGVRFPRTSAYVSAAHPLHLTSPQQAKNQ